MDLLVEFPSVRGSSPCIPGETLHWSDQTRPILSKQKRANKLQIKDSGQVDGMNRQIIPLSLLGP